MEKEREALEDSHREMKSAEKEAKLALKESERRLEAEKSIHEDSIEKMAGKHKRSINRITRDHEGVVKSALKKQKRVHTKELKEMESKHLKECGKLRFRLDLARREQRDEQYTSTLLADEVASLKEQLDNLTTEGKSTVREARKDINAEQKERTKRARDERSRLIGERNALAQQLEMQRKETSKVMKQKLISDEWSEKRLKRANDYHEQATHLQDHLTQVEDDRYVNECIVCA